jgi:hypothetical protein
MCAVDIPDPPKIEPVITLDPNAGKAAKVKTAANVKTPKKKSGLAQLSQASAPTTIQELLAGLTVGSSA